MPEQHSATAAAWIGHVMAGHRIEALIGEGGMGVVFRATHLNLRRTVALKVLPPALAGDQEYRRRFEREATIAASLEHPNVVPIYDAGYANGVLYLSMRFVDGEDLGAVLRREGRLSVERVCALLGPVADALDAVHEAGLVHRDVKPGNILIARARRPGAPPHVYLCDFGIAKGTTPGSDITSAGQFFGTVQYSSPEQIEGRWLDGRSDQYGLACLAHRSLTGEVPYPRTATSSVIYAHLSAPPPRPSEHRPDLPPGVDAAVARATAKDPDQRFPSCSAFIAALWAAVAAPPRPRPGPPPPVPRPAGPHPEGARRPAGPPVATPVLPATLPLPEPRDPAAPTRPAEPAELLVEPSAGPPPAAGPRPAPARAAGPRPKPTRSTEPGPPAGPAPEPAAEPTPDAAAPDPAATPAPAAGPAPDDASGAAPAPVDVHAERDPGDSSITVSWTPGGPQDVEYRVTRLTSDGRRQVVGRTRATSIVDGAVAPDADVPAYEVVARVGAAASDAARTPDRAAPEPSGIPALQNLSLSPAGTLVFDWPPGVTEAMVVVRADRAPESPTDPACTAWKITNMRYELDGGLKLPASLDRPCHVAVASCTREGGTLVVAPGFDPTARATVPA